MGRLGGGGVYVDIWGKEDWSLSHGEEVSLCTNNTLYWSGGRFSPYRTRFKHYSAHPAKIDRTLLMLIPGRIARIYILPVSWIRFGIILPDPDPGLTDMDPYPFQLNVKINYLDLERHQNGKSDPDRHQHNADPQHCIVICRRCFLGTYQSWSLYSGCWKFVYFSQNSRVLDPLVHLCFQYPGTNISLRSHLFREIKINKEFSSIVSVFLISILKYKHHLKVLSNGAGGGWRVVSIDQL